MGSRRISPERRGGGGDGGRDEASRGDRGAEGGCIGVIGRLGSLIGVGEPLGSSCEAAVVGSKNGDWSPDIIADAGILGGD